MSVVYNNIPQVIALLAQEIKDIIHEEPMLIKNDAAKAMNEPHGGRYYKRRGIQHRASAPGEAPAIDTGALVNSLEITYEGTLKSAVISNQEYALAQEMGRPEVNLLPRPYLRPAAMLAVKRINKRLSALKRRIESV